MYDANPYKPIILIININEWGGEETLVEKECVKCRFLKRHYAKGKCQRCYYQDYTADKKSSLPAQEEVILEEALKE